LRIIIDFKCTSCNNIDERFIEYTNESICTLCGCKAEKLLSSPTISLEGISGSFPSASDAWAKKHKISVQRD
jgi:predicted nucleic acid-binding Zn ribbon protein